MRADDGTAVVNAPHQQPESGGVENAATETRAAPPPARRVAERFTDEFLVSERQFAD